MFPESPGPDSLVSDRRSPLATSYRITAASFARALHRGWSPQELLDALNRLAERPLTGQETTMLRAWAEAAERTSIRRLTVLETSDPEVISRLASTRRGRSLIVQTLSPRAVVVDEARLDLLVRRLSRQEGVPPRLSGGAVGRRSPGAGEQRSNGAETQRRRGEIAATPPHLRSPAPLHAAGAAHAWLALRVYQGLGQYIRLPARTPQALLEHLSALADEDDPSPGSGHALAAAESAAEATLAALQEAMLGRVPFPPWPEEGMPLEESLTLIQQALAEGQALEMDYYTAGRDTLTHRVVEPYRLEQLGDTHYLVGFCRRAQAERVFRLDRIRWMKMVKSDDD